MWNNNYFLIWPHILQIFNEDMENSLKLLPSTKSDHVQLRPNSVMRVNLAAQVLSSTMSAMLENFGPLNAIETAKFCKMMNIFFHCLNVRSLEEYMKKRKPNLAPYQDINDPRFYFLENDFLQYFL